MGLNINLNPQQPPKAGSESSENVKSVSEKDTKNNASRKEKKYYNDEEEDKQDRLWHDAAKNHSWNDPPPKIKVTTKNGICHMNIEMTVGFTPDGTFDLFTNPKGDGFFDMDKWRDLLKIKSRKVLKEDGPRQIAKVDRILTWDFLSWSIPIPINIIVDENKKDLTGTFKKEKMLFMKVFEGNLKVKPIYVDAERLCKQKFPKSKEEYIRCSNGQGKIASKATMNIYFQPIPLFDIPPVSWFIRGITIKTTKSLFRTFLATAKTVREAKRHSK